MEKKTLAQFEEELETGVRKAQLTWEEVLRGFDLDGCNGATNLLEGR